MEAWVIACIVFVFAALMEYTGILLQVTFTVLLSVAMALVTLRRGQLRNLGLFGDREKRKTSHHIKQVSEQWRLHEEANRSVMMFFWRM